MGTLSWDDMAGSGWGSMAVSPPGWRRGGWDKLLGSRKGTLVASPAGCGTRDSVLDRRLQLPTCSVPHAAPTERPLRGFVVSLGRVWPSPPGPPHHQGMAKVLKIPPRCLNSSWDHRRRRRRRAARPALGRDLPRWGGHSIQLLGNPGLRTALSHHLSPRTAPCEAGGDPTSCDTPGMAHSAHSNHPKPPRPGCCPPRGVPPSLGRLIPSWHAA